MKKIDIIGENYFGKWDRTRTSCRGIIINDNNILLSYETLTDTWMIPGGGLEENETEKDCCIREISEETGIIVETSDCLLEIDEYYENYKFINKYFFCKPIEKTEIKLTENERRVGMTSRWLSVTKAIDIFSKYDFYKNNDEEKRGMYLRELTSLAELL